MNNKILVIYFQIVHQGKKTRKEGKKEGREEERERWRGQVMDRYQKKKKKPIDGTSLAKY